MYEKEKKRKNLYWSIYTQWYEFSNDFDTQKVILEKHLSQKNQIAKNPVDWNHSYFSMFRQYFLKYLG